VFRGLQTWLCKACPKFKKVRKQFVLAEAVPGDPLEFQLDAPGTSCEIDKPFSKSRLPDGIFSNQKF
jgi:hypothetical protein